jgi:hypothetical protein
MTLAVMGWMRIAVMMVQQCQINVALQGLQPLRLHARQQQPGEAQQIVGVTAGKAAEGEAGLWLKVKYQVAYASLHWKSWLNNVVALC